MKLLVLGGTVFLGRHIVEQALAAEHELTLFDRGQSNPNLFDGQVEKISGDRAGDLDKLTGKQFDACILSFSFQYLTQPVSVLRDLARLLKPGGACHIAFSNRLFPTKAVFCWQTATDFQRAEIVALCLDESGLYETPSAQQVVAPDRGCDPLYVVSARRKS